MITIIPEDISAVVTDTFDPDAEAVALRQAEARKAWDNGKQLTEGAYYRHSRYGGTRRILELKGNNIHWIDKYGMSVCLRVSFLRSVAGPL
jgi:phage terminase large subunit GpA-like protein